MSKSQRSFEPRKPVVNTHKSYETELINYTLAEGPGDVPYSLECWNADYSEMECFIPLDDLADLEHCYDRIDGCGFTGLARERARSAMELFHLDELKAGFA